MRWVSQGLNPSYELHVELEAEETTRRDHDGGDQADQYSFHPGDSVCRLRPKCHIVARDGMGV
jgi:hypothetical protein